tara:strand:+ start:93 stop:197 length:105 start_codon:yes stop_codon:yes gene_type:complete
LVLKKKKDLKLIHSSGIWDFVAGIQVIFLAMILL